MREIQGHLEEIYRMEVSPDLISAVTETVLEAVGEWRNRTHELCDPLVFFNAFRVKIRDEGFVATGPSKSRSPFWRRAARKY